MSLDHFPIGKTHKHYGNHSNVEFFTKLQIEPDFPCLADEIDEPRPYMNIKVAAFTVSEKSINTNKMAGYGGICRPYFS